MAYWWGGKFTGYEFEGILVNLPSSCTSVFFRVCFPVKRRSFQKSLLRLERIIHSQERSQASHAKVFRQPSGNSRLPERHLMGFTLHNSHLHRLTPHTAPHLTPHTLLFPKFTDPPYTALYLMMTASLERTRANQDRTLASQEETLISLEQFSARLEEQKKIANCAEMRAFQKNSGI